MVQRRGHQPPPDKWQYSSLGLLGPVPWSVELAVDWIRCPAFHLFRLRGQLTNAHQLALRVPPSERLDSCPVLRVSYGDLVEDRRWPGVPEFLDDLLALTVDEFQGRERQVCAPIQAGPGQVVDPPPSARRLQTFQSRWDVRTNQGRDVIDVMF